ncbi:hypothetical protein HID58_033449 [Brassica napus]|uniref:Uncharacterized protein n=1 Tax=Brassica napus TaxID=3708 RepID=A0ABQ8BZG3_BRANA|nr:hypothetical protein HID58_033449 [Brassica napus]
MQSCFVDDIEEKKGGSRRRVLLMFALGPSAWDEIHHAIFKASKVVYSASYNSCFILLGLFLPVAFLHSCFRFFMICQRKRLKGIISDSRRPFFHLVKTTIKGLNCIHLSCLFDSYEDSNFTRTGSTAVELFTHEMEPFLRKQCMPVRSTKGVHPDVDHVTVRWIPANTLFAITVSVIDQGLAQKYVYQNQVEQSGELTVKCQRFSETIAYALKKTRKA